MLSFHVVLLSAYLKALCKRCLHHYLLLYISVSSWPLLSPKIFYRLQIGVAVPYNYLPQSLLQPLYFITQGKWSNLVPIVHHIAPSAFTGGESDVRGRPVAPAAFTRTALCSLFSEEISFHYLPSYWYQLVTAICHFYVDVISHWNFILPALWYRL